MATKRKKANLRRRKPSQARAIATREAILTAYEGTPFFATAVFEEALVTIARALLPELETQPR